MDRQEQLRILSDAHGDPALLALATVDLTFGELGPEERDRLRKALEAAAIPHWVDDDVLAALLDEGLTKMAPDLLAGLRNLTVVEPFPARGLSAVNVHQATRLALRGRLAERDPNRLRSLARRASEYFRRGTADHERVEAAYHLLLCDPTAGIRTVEGLVDDLDWRSEHEPLRTLAAGLEEVLRTEKSSLLTDHVRGVMAYVVARIRWDYPRSEDDVDRTFSLAQKALAMTERSRDEAAIAVARDLVGEIRCSRGDLDDALRDFTETLRLREHLERSASRDNALQRGLARSHRFIGDVRFELGDRDEATGEFLKGRDIIDGLIAVEPDNVAWQSDLTTFYDRIGDVEMSRSKLNRALDAYRSSLAIRQTLAARDPGNSTWQRDVSVSQDHIGDVLQAKRDWAAAFEQYRPGVETGRLLAARDPSNVDLQWELSIGLEKIGDVQFATDALEDALGSYRAGLVIRSGLLARDPNDRKWQRETSVLHDRIGCVLRAQGDLDGALKAYVTGLSMALELVSHEPDNVEWQYDALVGYRCVGDVLLALRKLDEALDRFQRSLVIAEDLVARDPQSVAWQREPGYVHAKIGEVLEQQGFHEDALTAYRRSLAVRTRFENVDEVGDDSGEDVTTTRERLSDTIAVARSALRTARMTAMSSADDASLAAVLIEVAGVVDQARQIDDLIRSRAIRSEVLGADKVAKTFEDDLAALTRELEQAGTVQPV